MTVQSIMIWVSMLAVVAAVVGVYVTQFLKQRRQASRRLLMTHELGMDRPTGQYPLIDAGACIGCGTCVDACPEGDVLGVVMGKAVVINGARCIGHGRCAEACPVGAIEIGLGDVTRRDDIPLLDDFNQTSVPGLWIAGELSGFALINNAVEQGKMVAERIADLIASPGDSDEEMLDLLVVGAGPAGMSAGLRALDHGLHCRVIDQQAAGGTILQYPRRKLVMVQPCDFPRIGRLPKLEYSKEELLEIWKELSLSPGLEIRTGLRMTGLTGEEGGFTVRTTEGEMRARHVVLALGRRGTPRRLNVPGEDSAKVAYRLIDAEAYEGRRVLVVGGGDSAVEAAAGLSHQKDCRVTISYRKPAFLRIKQRNQKRIESLIAKGVIDFRGDTIVESIGQDAVLLNGPEGSVEIPNDDVFILAGGIPPFGMLKEMGVRFGGDQKDIGMPTKGDPIS